MKSRRDELLPEKKSEDLAGKHPGEEAVGESGGGDGIGPLAPRLIQNAWTIDRPFDDVWQAAIEVLPEMQLTVANMEKDSGFIRTDPLNFLAQGILSTDNSSLCDCGVGLKELGRQGNFNVFVKKVGSTQTEMKMIAVYEVFFRRFKRSCISTGGMEAEFYKRILERLR